MDKDWMLEPISDYWAGTFEDDEINEEKYAPDIHCIYHLTCYQAR